ncbi:MAG: AMMECR1 domain-containing protein, partial [Thermoanaerobaculia bacterium]|nr:AMMECR1 domain-containing protein [Thermoanaerobaculia bacterium]
LVAGRDGLVLTCRRRRATFLPQVWTQLPEPGEFLRELKRKAGLDAAYWSPEVTVERYEVASWSET